MPNFFKQRTVKPSRESLEQIVCPTLIESEYKMATTYSVAERSIRNVLYNVICESTFKDLNTYISKNKGITMPLESKIISALAGRHEWMYGLRDCHIRLSISHSYNNGYINTYILVFCSVKFFEKGSLVFKQIQMCGPSTKTR